MADDNQSREEVYVLLAALASPIYEKNVVMSALAFSSPQAARSAAPTFFYNFVNSSFRGGVEACSDSKFRREDLDKYDSDIYEDFWAGCDDVDHARYVRWFHHGLTTASPALAHLLKCRVGQQSKPIHAPSVEQIYPKLVVDDGPDSTGDEACDASEKSDKPAKDVVQPDAIQPPEAKRRRMELGELRYVYLVAARAISPTYDMYVRLNSAVFAQQQPAEEAAHFILYDIVNDSFRGGAESCAGVRFRREEVGDYSWETFNKLWQSCDTGKPARYSFATVDVLKLPLDASLEEAATLNVVLSLPVLPSRRVASGTFQAASLKEPCIDDDSSDNDAADDEDDE